MSFWESAVICFGFCISHPVLLNLGRTRRSATSRREQQNRIPGRRASRCSASVALGGRRAEWCWELMSCRDAFRVATEARRATVGRSVATPRSRSAARRAALATTNRGVCVADEPEESAPHGGVHDSAAWEPFWLSSRRRSETALGRDCTLFRFGNICFANFAAVHRSRMKARWTRGAR
eukprot:Selendium_serpulae@DN6360_c0_g1_i2.p2